ncbi:MAG: CPBP family intramembrane metalloprotease [Waddliaceae bacterium]|nr:CPBP family intramembrane metalloprotease [Waddliaceae bacterium]
MEEHINKFFISFAIAIVTTLLAWKKGFFRIDTPEKGRISLWEALFAFVICLVVVPFVTTFIIYAVSAILSLDIIEKFHGWMVVLTICVTFITIVAYTLGVVERKAVKQLFGDFTMKNVAIGALTWCVAAPVVIATVELCAIVVLYITGTVEGEQSAVTQFRATMEYPVLKAVMAVMIVTIVPFTEELLFRGYLQNFLKKITSRSVAIIVTALIFTMFHYSYGIGMKNIVLLSGLFVFSIALGYICERQKSLWAAITLHMIFNAVTITALF